jgi:hypothetical protein
VIIENFLYIFVYLFDVYNLVDVSEISKKDQNCYGSDKDLVIGDNHVPE